MVADIPRILEESNPEAVKKVPTPMEAAAVF